jgi:hypothetical protein
MEPVIRALKTKTSKKIAINKGLFPTVLLPKVEDSQFNKKTTSITYAISPND